MDVTCRRCREPWEAYYLRHDMHWWWCHGCGQSVQRSSDGQWTPKSTDADARRRAERCEHAEVELEIEPATNGEVPPQVRAWTEAGQPGWLRFVAAGHGCPDCYGTTPPPAEPLDAATLDKIDVATEGMAFSGWF